MKKQPRNWGEMQRAEQDRSFFHGWDWLKVTRHWQSICDASGYSVPPFFTEMHVYDPAFSNCREEILTWCPPSLMHEHQLNMQEHSDHQYRGKYLRLHVQGFQPAELKTLAFLWRLKGDRNAVTALLIAASLFGRMGRGGSHRDQDYWPPRECLNKVYKWATDSLKSSEVFWGWHHMSTTVIPHTRPDDGVHIDSMEDLIQHLAKEHIELFQEFLPVVVRFVNVRDAHVMRGLVERRAKEATAERMRLDNLRVAEQQRRDELNRRKLAHPRCEEWGALPRDELEQLVWAQPTSTIADAFGISGVAVAKRCKKLGIHKPPRGYWAKVAAGKKVRKRDRPINGPVE